jgi:DnaJ-class molecular chaperone
MCKILTADLQAAVILQLSVQQQTPSVDKVFGNQVILGHYDVLGASRVACREEIKTCYKRSLLRTHPDKGGSEEAVLRVMAAFEVLGCEATRKIYDAQFQHTSKSCDMRQSVADLEED